MTEQMAERLATLKTFLDNPGGRLSPPAQEALIQRKVGDILQHLDEEETTGRAEVLDQLSSWGLTPR